MFLGIFFPPYYDEPMNCCSRGCQMFTCYFLIFLM
ncbi:MAG: hypothetical protein LBM60_01790 [Clostridium sp.]|nr:hypothetical protein [Clostridium sp.]